MERLYQSGINVPSISVLDILDIAIVAYIIYKIIFWIKETRAWALFKGFFVLLIFMAVAWALSLNTILWILNRTLSVGVIAIVIIFQPELRKALEKLGRNRIFRGTNIFDNGNSNEYISDKTADEVVKAVEKMSAVKTGALILLEKNVPLGDHERTGISLDAAVSSQLLINIFEKNTPLHDGAVIIRNNRVAAATCFLPISENPDISMELGTRHRAALGVSEISDALVVVVSEETGAISLSREGVLYRNLTPETLRGMLKETAKKNVSGFNLWRRRGNGKD
ncbi:MAG: diadenylate cyclase CdaA [Firmicutes bacterium]|nr:diadenylate cyclase CdaA [Bacillota bacterium]